MIIVKQSDAYKSYNVRPLAEEASSGEELQRLLKRMAIAQCALTESRGLAIAEQQSRTIQSAYVDWPLVHETLKTFSAELAYLIKQNERPLSAQHGIYRVAGKESFLINCGGKSQMMNEDEFVKFLTSYFQRMLADGKTCQEIEPTLDRLCSRVTTLKGNLAAPFVVSRHFCYSCTSDRYWIHTENRFVCGSCSRTTERFA